MNIRKLARRATVLSVATASLLSGIALLTAGPINPMVFKKKFEEARTTAEVVAHVRVLAASCVDKGGENGKDLTLQLALQVLRAEKGPIKKGQVLTVTHAVRLPAGPGPRAYGYMAAVRQFPFTPGVDGDVALRWEAKQRCYLPIAGWVAQPNGAAVPAEWAPPTSRKRWRRRGERPGAPASTSVSVRYRHLRAIGWPPTPLFHKINRMNRLQMKTGRRRHLAC
jgi:hypothetical protein